MNSLITRFAPSPTGNLHIGSLRTALINYILTTQAKKQFPKSKFLLRIEDTDKIRSNDKYKRNIINGLKWIGIDYDDKPYIQSTGIKRHRQIAFDLVKRKKAFKCICDIKDLEEIRKKK